MWILFRCNWVLGINLYITDQALLSDFFIDFIIFKTLKFLTLWNLFYHSSQFLTKPFLDLHKYLTLKIKFLAVYFQLAVFNSYLMSFIDLKNTYIIFLFTALFTSVRSWSVYFRIDFSSPYRYKFYVAHDISNLFYLLHNKKSRP